MKVLVENPNIPLCCSEFAFFHDTPQKETADIIYTNHLIKNTKNVQVYSHKKIVDAFRKTTFWIPGHTVIVKRSIVLDHQGLNESLGPFSDFFLLHSIALLYGAAYIPENLSALRLIGESYSNVESRNRKISRKNELNLIDMICNKSSADLRYLFRRSGLINGYLRKRFMDLVLFPKYWDFLISSFIRFIERRTYKIGKRISSMRR